MNGIILTHLPETCRYCDYRYDIRCMADNGHRVQKDDKPDWCPIQPIPEQMTGDSVYSIGWNDCLNEIIGKANVNCDPVFRGKG